MPTAATLTVYDRQRRCCDASSRTAPQAGTSQPASASCGATSASALPLVRRAIELDASYADAHNLLGAILATAGDIGAGRDAFRTSLRLDPRDAVTYVNLAQLELAAGQRDVAADLFAEALSLDPNSSSARDGLAQARASADELRLPNFAIPESWSNSTCPIDVQGEDNLAMFKESESGRSDSAL